MKSPIQEYFQAEREPDLSETGECFQQVQKSIFRGLLCVDVIQELNVSIRFALYALHSVKFIFIFNITTNVRLGCRTCINKC